MDEDVQYVGMRLPPIHFVDGLAAPRRSTSGTGIHLSINMDTPAGAQPRTETYGGQHPDRPRGGASRPEGPGGGTRTSARADVLTTVLAGITLAVQRTAHTAPYDLSFHRSGDGVVEIGRKSSAPSGRRASAGAGEGGGRTANTERYAVFACQVVSAKHAKLVFTASGQVYIVDLGSRHGTHILKRGEDISRTIQPGVEALLDDGDLVTFGKTVGAGRQMVEPVTVRVKLLRRTLRTTATAATGRNTASLGGNVYSSDSDSSTSLPSPPRANGGEGDAVNASGGGTISRNNSAGRYGLFEPPSEHERSSDGENEHGQGGGHHGNYEQRSERGASAVDVIDVEDWRSTLHEPMFGDVLPKDAEYIVEEEQPEITQIRLPSQISFEEQMAMLEEFAQGDKNEEEEDEEEEGSGDGSANLRLDTSSEMDMGTPAPAYSSEGAFEEEEDMEMETPREQSRAASEARVFDLHLPDVPTHVPELVEPSVEPEEGVTLASVSSPASKAEGQGGSGGARGKEGAAEQREDLPSLRTILSDITPTPFEQYNTLPRPNGASGSPVVRHMSVPVSEPSSDASSESSDNHEEDEEMSDETEKVTITELQESCERIQNAFGELYSSVDALENDVRTVSEDLEDVHAHLERLDKLSDTSTGRLQNVESRLSALVDVKTQVEDLQARVDAVAAVPQETEDKEVYMRELRCCTKDLNVIVADIRELHRETRERLNAAVEEVLAARKDALAAIQSEVQAFNTLKRKRSDHEMAIHAVPSVPQEPVIVTLSQSPSPEAPPPSKRSRSVLSLTARTATAVAFGAVATWSALAFS